MRWKRVVGRAALGFMGLVNWTWEHVTGERKKQLEELQKRRKAAEKRRGDGGVVYREESPTWHERLVDDEDP